MRRRLTTRLCAILLMVQAAFGGVYKQYPKYYEGPTTGSVVDGATHDGEQITIDLPVAQHIKNFGAPLDGKGLCVFCSLTHAARWHNIGALENLVHEMREGGGWPEKVDRVLRDKAPDVAYVQDEGVGLDLLRHALAQRKMVCVTYGYSERYQMKTVYHMVNLVHLSDRYAAVLDNNFPGTYEWMTPAEFSRRYVHPSGKGWAVIFAAPAPPPVPSN